MAFPKMNFGERLGSAFGAAAPAFLESFYGARRFARDEQQAQAMEAHRKALLEQKQRALAFREQSTARGQDLRERGLGIQERIESGRGTRFDRQLEHDRSMLLARPLAEYAPGAAAGVLGAPEYAEEIERSAAIARANKLAAEGALAGRRAGAAASARSGQKQRDNQAMYETEQALDGKGEMPKKPFYPSPRQAGKPTAEKLQDAGVSTDQSIIRRVLGMVEKGADIPPGLQQSAVKARARQLGIDFSTMPPEQATQIQDQIAASLGLTE